MYGDWAEEFQRCNISAISHVAELLFLIIDQEQEEDRALTIEQERFSWLLLRSLVFERVSQTVHQIYWREMHEEIRLSC